MPATPHVSRLFHAVVLMGCALGTGGCEQSKGSHACHTPDGGFPDGGAPSGDAGACGAEDDAGWPPTK